jgi:hypothetical protein
MKPSAGEPAQTVRITVSANEAPGLRQFLNRRADPQAAAEAAAEAAPESGPSAPVVPPPGPGTVPAWVGAVLLAADAVVVGLSAVLLGQGQSPLLQALGGAGILAGAVLGVLGVVLLVRER